jgi:hypothetical protein
MSTKATIFYDDENDVHIYEEMLTGEVWVEVSRPGSYVNVRLMSLEEWLKYGFPLYVKHDREVRQ